MKNITFKTAIYMSVAIPWSRWENCDWNYTL